MPGLNLLNLGDAVIHSCHKRRLEQESKCTLDGVFFAKCAESYQIFLQVKLNTIL